jgi:hypothetical protein
MTQAEKAWAKLVKQETATAKYKVGDRVKYRENGEVYEITKVVMGIFGGVEYRTQSLESEKRGIAFDNLIPA